MRTREQWLEDMGTEAANEINGAGGDASAFIAAIQADALNEAAKVADSDDAGGKGGGFDLLRHRIARRIRSLIPPAPPTRSAKQ